MARKREDLHELLLTLVPNVYFQPPPDLTMKFPCIVYSRNDSDTVFADDLPYAHTKRYEVTVIDEDADSVIPDQLAGFPMCLFDRFFVADYLNHDVFHLYF